MNLRKSLFNIFVFITLLLALLGCSYEAKTPNTAYGELVSGGSAPKNPNFGGATTIPMTTFNESFVNLIVCKNISTESTQADNYATYCVSQNQNYVNQESILFGLSGVESVGNFVNTRSQAALVNKAKFDAITYTTPGAPYMFAGQTVAKEIASGLVILPTDINGNVLQESQIKGVILYYHSTIFSKGGVPSGYSNISKVDNNSTYFTQFELASVYTSSGYIVVAPDYVGLGVNNNVVHPYAMFPNTNALSGIYMIKALSTYLKNAYGVNLNKINSTGGRSNPNLYITSYSEGASYALRSTDLIQGSYANIISSTGLTLKRTVGVSGAYDLTNQMIPFIFSNTTNGLAPESNPWMVSPGCDPNISGNVLCNPDDIYLQSMFVSQILIGVSKPSLAAYMVNAMVTYDYTPSAYNLVMEKAFAQQSSCLNPSSLLGKSGFQYISCERIPSIYLGTGGDYNVQQLFNANGLNNLQIISQLFLSAIATNNYFIGSSNDFIQIIEALTNGNPSNSLANIVHPELMQDASVMSLISQANTHSWTTSIPLSLLYLKYDSVITPRNSLSACNLLGNNGISVINGGSLNCVQIDNSKLWTVLSSDSLGLSAPGYDDHVFAEGLANLAALNQIVTNPK